jgi:hypothetical protein
MSSKFDSIRPFDDAELPSVLTNLSNNQEFIDSIVAFRFAAWPKYLYPLLKIATRRYILHKKRGIANLRDFQRLVEPYIERMIKTTTESLTITGIDKLDLSKACLFVSNHRDIALDPAFVNWALHINQQDTVRIAVGDNLLHNEWVADIIRLNKCFIVKRSATDRREKLKAAKLLSEYINHTLNHDAQHIWIAQKEGRAKDGNDLTNPAIVSMLCLNKPKTTEFADYVNQLRIVPVSISYEFDPCDVSKARELRQLEQEGSYDKPDNEDMRSIINGITGQKGRVHIHFGEQLQGQYENAKDVAEQIDQQVLSGYKPFSTGAVAAAMLTPNSDSQSVFEKNPKTYDYLTSRLQYLSQPEQTKLLAMYAAPFLRQQ